MVASPTPNIAKIRRDVGDTDLRALLTIAVTELCDFFNVGKNMSAAQIALTVDLIAERYWYMKLEEIKSCFRRAMRSARVYDRMDGNLILGWLAEYDDERTAEAMRQADATDPDAEPAARPSADPGAMSFDEYIAELQGRRAGGDAAAAGILADVEAMPQGLDESRDKERDFKVWRMMEYLPGVLRKMRNDNR